MDWLGSTVWSAIRYGIVLLLANRAAARITNTGQFVESLVLLIGVALVLTLVRQEFLISLPKRYTQFDGIRQVVITLAEIVVLFLAYVLAAAVSQWFESNYMNGPQVLELALIVLLIIALFGVAAQRVLQYSKPKPRDVDRLLEIAKRAVS